MNRHVTSDIRHRDIHHGIRRSRNLGTTSYSPSHIRPTKPNRFPLQSLKSPPFGIWAIRKVRFLKKKWSRRVLTKELKIVPICYNNDGSENDIKWGLHTTTENSRIEQNSIVIIVYIACLTSTYGICILGGDCLTAQSRRCTPLEPKWPTQAPSSRTLPDAVDPFSLLVFDLTPAEYHKSTPVPLPPVIPSMNGRRIGERNFWDVTVGYHSD